VPGPVFALGSLTYIGDLNALSAASPSNAADQGSNFTAVRGFRYPITINNLTSTLPIAPAAGDTLMVFSKAVSTVNKITLGRNGQNIEGVAADKVITVDNFLLVVVYIDVTYGWKVFNMSAPQVNSTTPQIFRRNLVINPNFDIAQRGTTYALTTAVAYGSVDRWGFKMAGTAAGVANQVDAQAQGFVGFKNCVKLGRTAGSALTGVISAQTAFETIDSVKWQGKNVVLTIAFKAGANFSGANVAVKLYTGKGTDQSLVSMEAGTWTTSATPINTTQVITNAALDYSFTVALPSDITQLGVQVSYTPVGTAGADDSLYFTGVDFSEGTTAPPREFRPITLETVLCKRYYRRYTSGGSNLYHSAGTASGTATGLCPCPYAADMRALPTINYSALADMFGFSNGGATVAATLTISGAVEAPTLTITTAGAPWAAGQAVICEVVTGAGKYIDFSVEL
jgi:hypothetical protein